MVKEALVWYAAYGSNVDRDRFSAYLRGGPVAATGVIESGARDPSPPRQEEPCRFDRPIRFAHHSRRWNGATAVLDHSPGTGIALGRRYLITAAQLADVVAQENRRAPSELPLDALTVGEVHALSPGGYDGILLLGLVDGIPVITFTSPVQPTELEPAPPSAAYLRTMGVGIKVAHGLTAVEVGHHLHRAPGVSPHWTVEGISALVE